MSNPFDFDGQPVHVVPTTRVIQRHEASFMTAFGRTFGGTLGVFFGLVLCAMFIYGGSLAVRKYYEHNTAQYRSR